MNAPSSQLVLVLPAAPEAPTFGAQGHVRRLRALLSLFTMYACALVAIIALSDGGDVGCVLVGIAGHVLYATAKSVREWQAAILIDDARLRSLQRRLAHA